MMSINLYLKIKNADCYPIISEMRRSEATKLLENVDFTEKSGAL